MKIAPAPPAPASRQAVAASPFVPATASSFAELLGEDQDRAFGFSELGLLETRAGAAPALPQPAGRTEPPAHVGEPTQAAEPPPTSHALSEARSGRRFQAEPLDRQGPSAATRANAPSLPPGTGAQAPSPLASRQPADEGAPVAGAKAAGKRPPPGAASTRLSLTFSEQDGVMRIVAGSPELSPSARDRLRKAAAALAAEFGVTLAEFTLNGLDLQPSQPPRIGAPHGDHTG